MLVDGSGRMLSTSRSSPRLASVWSLLMHRGRDDGRKFINAERWVQSMRRVRSRNVR